MPEQRRPYWRSRWRGEVALRNVLWTDMLLVGTLVNVLASFVALLAISQGAQTWLGVLIHFAPLPYNLWLFAVVARASPRSPRALLWAGAWLALMVVA